MTRTLRVHSAKMLGSPGIEQRMLDILSGGAVLREQNPKEQLSIQEQKHNNNSI